MLISIVCWNNIYVQHLYLLLLTCLVFLIKYWTPVIVCNVDYICIGLKLSLLMLASYYVHRNPNWSRETCSSFPWISNVVKLLKRMPLHLPRSKFVWCMMHIIILIFKGFITLAPEQKILKYLLYPIRFPVMIIHRFLYLLQQKVSMRDRWYQSYMSLNLVHSQVLVCTLHVNLILFICACQSLMGGTNTQLDLMWDQFFYQRSLL